MFYRIFSAEVLLPDGVSLAHLYVAQLIIASTIKYGHLRRCESTQDLERKVIQRLESILPGLEDSFPSEEFKLTVLNFAPMYLAQQSEYIFNHIKHHGVNLRKSRLDNATEKMLEEDPSLISYWSFVRDEMRKGGWFSRLLAKLSSE